MKKRSLALLTAFVIASVHKTLPGKLRGLRLHASDNQATITGYSGDGVEAAIAAEVDGVSATNLGD